MALMGDETCLRSIADQIMGSLKGVAPVEVIGLDMEQEREAVFHDAVYKACNNLGHLDAFVNCYAYEGELHFIFALIFWESKIRWDSLFLNDSV